MLQDDCALIVDVQSDTSPIQDFNHLVLLLHDNDSCELVYVWQLAGFQSRLTANHDPMSQEKWTMSGDNPRPYNQDWSIRREPPKCGTWARPKLRSERRFYSDKRPDNSYSCSRCRLRRANQNGGRANRERIVDEPSEDADNAYSICGLSMELWPETV
ncbi:uncharacterized protein N7506_004127 [Penicillium brevicompactum]|uniref:uncharacterized protein n=1 Tax=Penicillium brevicompactum TaxID=5074 RepID=UPI00253FE172|nr:uncharacterized protein N7506_004127 [Penicillium brevicompactum]KAJ5336105.1 hypothetical protein N7506_004127 [Penicillium brevicompactum]